ncbi:hypothetical protein DFO70_102505 [Cytobacillus firmus]|uniref:Uncharacterized protein n=2 Tax=Cytobacillus TaxID=2675230 RepID=A0A366K4V0_CYTFI|nr:hypothetical protein DFO70_102505 [Cytobacillus firmus]TDX45091.1 hypothetical protein DFO72_103505 [Cytobacillus oceanisediminis]
MRRIDLKIFTAVSFYIALAPIIIIHLSIIILSRTSVERLDNKLEVIILLAFLASVSAIPLSIVSMFSRKLI